MQGKHKLGGPAWVPAGNIFEKMVQFDVIRYTLAFSHTKMTYIDFEQNAFHANIEYK